MGRNLGDKDAKDGQYVFRKCTVPGKVTQESETEEGWVGSSRQAEVNRTQTRTREDSESG